MIWAKYRPFILFLVYVLFFLHTALWHYWGYTGVGHLGFGEFFGTFRSGIITAGTIFTIVIFLHAMMFGGLFCGWMCHWGINQDLAAWMMRKLGIKPMMTPLNTKLIPWFWFIVILAQVVLFWFFSGFPTSLSFNPSATPVWSGVPRSILAICITTIVSCFALIFLFGERAFCRSICTFRLWFSWFERIAPHKVRQIKECSSCALECSNVCPMGIDVAQEIKNLGHVKNPECIKCHVCVGACPAGALQTMLKKNDFHRDGPPVYQPDTFSPSISYVQVAMAIIILVLFGFDIGGNMSLSLGLLTGYVITRVIATRQISAFETFSTILIFIGLYYMIDMNDFSSLAKGLLAIALFLAAARFINYDPEFKFIHHQAKNTSVPKPVFALILIAALIIGAREAHTSMLIHQANAALSNKDLQAYASIMEGCAAGHSNPAGTYFDLGKVQLQIKQPAKALYSFKRSIDLRYDFAAANAMLESLFATENFEQWLQMAEYLAQKYPDKPRFKVIKAAAMAQLKRWPEAEKLLDEMIKADPKNHEPFIALGEIRQEQAKLIEARELFEKAYAIAPASSAFFLAGALSDLNMQSEAEQYYSEAIRNLPQNILIRFDQGTNYAMQQKFREAISSWESILAQNPDFEAAKENIAKAKQALEERKARILGESAN